MARGLRWFSIKVLKFKDPKGKFTQTSMGSPTCVYPILGNLGLFSLVPARKKMTTLCKSRQAESLPCDTFPGSLLDASLVFRVSNLVGLPQPQLHRFYLPMGGGDTIKLYVVVGVTVSAGFQGLGLGVGPFSGCRKAYIGITFGSLFFSLGVPPDMDSNIRR